VIDTIDREGLLANAERMGGQIRQIIEQKTAGTGRLVETRGRGLMLGFQLDRDCPELVADALQRGLLINVTGGNTVRLLPPLNISAAQATELAEGVADLILTIPAPQP
jgi:acetylornithine aminotransferase